MSDERETPRDDAIVPSPETPDLSKDKSNDMTPGMPGTPGHSSDAEGDSFAPYDLDGYVLGVSSDDDAAQVRAAADADPRIAEEIRVRQDIVAQFAFAVPPVQINRGRSAGIRSRLVSKAASAREGRVPVSRKTAELLRPLLRPRDTSRDAGRDGGSGASSGPSLGAPLDTTAAAQLNSVRRRYQVALAAFAVAMVMVMGLQQMRVAHAADGVRETLDARDQALSKRLDSLLAVSAHKDSLLASFTGPDMKVIDLVNYSSQGPLARMFWEQKAAEWTMYAYHLRQPKPGKTFQVWLVTTTAPAPISAGTFTPNPDGSFVMHAKYPLDRDALVKVAVSEEPAGGVPAPTGPIIIAGAGR